MRALIQEACQGAVRDVVAGQAARLADLSEADLRPVNLRDFQARCSSSTTQSRALQCASRLYFPIWMASFCAKQ